MRDSSQGETLRGLSPSDLTVTGWPVGQRREGEDTSVSAPRLHSQF